MKISFCRNVSLLVVVSTFLLVQKVSANPDGFGNVDDYAEEIPLDGGISLLLAAGVAYGAKKGYESRKRKNQPNG